VPLCKVIRFNIEYSIHIIEEDILPVCNSTIQVSFQCWVHFLDMNCHVLCASLCVFHWNHILLIHVWMFMCYASSGVFTFPGLPPIYFLFTDRLRIFHVCRNENIRNSYLSFYWKKWFYIWYMALAWWLVPCLSYSFICMSHGKQEVDVR
jgi:hypothetical protein